MATTLNYLDDGPLTRRQLFIISVASLGLFLDGYNLLVLAGALLVVIPTYHLTPIQIGLVTGMAFFGMIVGSLVAGPLTDRLGRRPVFIADMMLFIVAAGLCIFIQRPVELIVLRFLTGVAIGADQPTSYSIIAEFAPRSKRGMFEMLTGAYWFFGSFCGAIVGYLIFRLGSLGDWRFILASGLVPAIVVLILRRDVPETPRWLLSQGRAEEGFKAMTEATDGRVVPSTGMASTAVTKNLTGRVLRQGRGLYLLIFVSLFWFLENAYGSSFLLYQPVILKQVVVGSALRALLYTAVVQLFVVAAAIVASVWLVERLGRRIMAIWPSLIMAVCLVIMAAVIHTPWVVIPAFTIAAMCDYGCIASVYYAWGSELFPTGVRGRALGLSNAAGKFGSLTGVVFFPSLFKISPVVAFGVLAVVVLVDLVIVYIMAPETKGRSLDDLEREALG